MITLRCKRMAAAAAVIAVGVTAASMTTLSAIGGAGAQPPKPDLLVIEDTPEGTRVAVLDESGAVIQGDLKPIVISTNQFCEVRPQTALDSLVGLQIRSGTATLPLQLISSRLGARQTRGGPCSDSNARVLAGQSFNIGIGTKLAERGYAFDGATINIQSFQGAGLKVSLDGEVVATNQLVQERLTIAPPEGGFFTSIELSLSGSSGSFGLRSSGGQAGGRSEFSLTQVGIPVDCGDEVGVEFEDPSVEKVVFNRLDDKAVGDDTSCSTAFVRIEVTSEGVLIDPIGDADRIQARVSITWRVARSDGGNPRSVTEINEELTREVRYPDADITGPNEGFVPVEYCKAVAAGVVDPLPPTSNQPWCVLEDDRVLAGSEIIQTVTFYVSGDPLFR